MHMDRKNRDNDGNYATMQPTGFLNAPVFRTAGACGIVAAGSIFVLPSSALRTEGAHYGKEQSNIAVQKQF